MSDVALVTGGIGYLGSRLIRDLPVAGDWDAIRILDNYRQPRYNSLWDLPSGSGYDFVSGDIRDQSAVEWAMRDVDTVFHLAAITNAPETFDIPQETWDVNYDAAVDVYKTAAIAGVDTFVNISTASVYGETDEPLIETAHCDPESPYAKAKLAAETDMVERMPTNTRLVSLRLGTVFGWTRGMRFDTVVNKFSLLAATGQALTIHRPAYESQAERPYLHVDDAVEAMVHAATNDLEGIYNVVGTNAPISEVVDTVRDAFPDVETTLTDGRLLNQVSYVVDDSKLRETGFSDRRTLEEGVEEMAEKFGGLVRA